MFLALVMIHSDAKRGLDVPSSLIGLQHLSEQQKLCGSSPTKDHLFLARSHAIRDTILSSRHRSPFPFVEEFRKV